MNFVATLEECLRDLAYMARPNNNSSKRLPGVKEASERAIQKLRQLQVGYISAIRKASSATPDKNDAAPSQHPTTSIFQSSDLLHPFLLALNYPNADFKLVEISLRAIRLLMEADAIVPTDSIHILRVYQIQAIVVTTFYNNKLLHQIHHNQRSSVAIPALYGNEDQDDEPNDTMDAASKDGAESVEGSDITASSVDDSSKPIASEVNKTAAASNSSWFSWGSSTASTTKTPSSAAPTSAASIPTRSSFTIKRNAVSSSSGGVGATSLSAQHMEKLALEILSSLVQLMELLRNYHPTVLNSVELWTNATALACLFGFQWYTPYQQQHIGQVPLSASSVAANATSTSSTAGGGSSRQSTVQQAASSTVSQLMSLLFFCQSDQNYKLIQSTWEDLLLLINSSHTPSISTDSQRKPSMSTLTLSGAFKQCKRKATLFDDNASNVAEPPSPEFALELMTQIFKESMSGHNAFSPTEQLLTKSMGITLSMIQKLPQKTTVEKSLRIVQWTLTFIQVHAAKYRNESRELFVQLLKQIPFTTDSCRSHPDFEDGYVYSSLNDESKYEGNKRKSPADSLATLFPMPSLWKSGFVLEAIYCILDRGIADELSILLDDPTIVQNLVESLSDFATIGTSCHDHILQVVEFFDLQNPSNMKPTIFRKAEQSIAMGINFSLSGSSSLIDASTSLKNTSIDKSKRGLTLVLGEIVWLSLQGILRINDCLFLRISEPSTLDSASLFREIFPPSLSIWQHVLKRFIGSAEIVQLALRGYSIMADICLPMKQCAMERKVLITSLSKLSLPSWGKHDSSAQLQDHHIRTLLCLLRIIHVHYDNIMAEWEVVMWTFEELSVLNVASPLLSDEAYHASLAIAAGYERFAGFSTCFSDESVKHIVNALSNICESTMSKRDLVGDSDTVLHERTKQVLDPSESDHVTIGEKIMSTAVRAFYGSSSTDAEKTDESPRLERTKHLYYQEYRIDLLNRVSKSKFTLRTNSIGRIPFVLVALVDIVMSNMFRSKECCRVISGHLSDLATVSPIVRPLIMDILTMLMMSQLSDDLQLPVSFIGPGKVVIEDPMHSQLLAVEKTPQVESMHHFSQIEVLSPLCDSIKTSERADVAKASLDCLTSILEGTGHNLRGEVWSLMIDAIASLSGDLVYGEARATSDWAGCCLAAFRSLKFIVNDFLGQLPIKSSESKDESVAAHMSLLECCCSFVTSRHDVNTSLTAIGLLWTIADQDTGTESIDSALSKLVLLSSDDRPEVRNAVVNTFFSCIAGRGGSFTSSYWKSCMNDKVFRLYDVVNEQLFDGHEPPVDEPDDGKKSSRYYVQSHHTRDSSTKLWVATQVIVVQGLVRILRIFFLQLLEADTETEVPWFRDAWVKMLNFALHAACQGGGRDNLDIRLAGVELLALCCQLSCKGGIQAGGTPARVSTNMEVVNGALRTVRDSPPSKSSLQRTSSLMVDGLRQSLFVAAFESLEDFEAEVLHVRKIEDDTDLQVLSKFCTYLGRLYDCGRDVEFTPECETKTKVKFAPLSGRREADVEMASASLESRFAGIVVSAMEASTVDLKARYLNQGQRGCFDVLRAMASSGSSVAFERLVDFAGLAFFIKNDGYGEESEIADEHDETPSALLSMEAATIVSKEICHANVSDECKVVVLYQVMGIFLTDKIIKRRQYKIFIPILQSGVEGARQLSVKSDQQYIEIVDLVWKGVLECLSLMFSPIQIGEDLWKISRASELITVVAIVRDNVPQSYVVDLCKALSAMAMKIYEVAGKHAIFGTSDPESVIGRKSKRHYEDLLKLFAICFSSGCELGPDEDCIASVASAVFSTTSSTTVEPMLALGTDATISICQALENRNVNALIIAVFPQLCALILSDNVRLKQAAGRVLTNANIAATLQESQSRFREAEKRANEAEKVVIDLESMVIALQQEKSQLQEELVVAKESSRRSLW